MHEWALAEAVISTALKVSRKERFKEIVELKVKMGELQQIDLSVFEFAFKEIAKSQSSALKKVNIGIEIEKATLRCRVCGNLWAFNDITQELSKDESESIHFIPEMAHVYIRCPRCGSPDFEVIKGRGVWIESIEGER